MSFQTWIGMGNLTSDPEMKYVGQTPKTIFSIAINEKRGEKEETIFVDVECWDKVAESVAEYKRKGDQVLVQGRWKMDEWEDQDGKKKRKWYVRADQVRFVGAPRDNDDRGSRRSRDDDDRPRRSRDDRDDRPRRRDDRDEEPRRGSARDDNERERYSDLPF